MSIKIDLHCHSSESDGSLSCRELIARAIDKNVSVLAITDHDTTAAHTEAVEIAHGLSTKFNEDNLADQKSKIEPIKIIAGVEISALSNTQELHIVGLGIDIDNDQLQSLLENNRQIRKQRSKKILLKLQKSGLGDLTDQLNELVPADVICRSHLAQLLCEQGIVKDFKKAFKRYLGKKGRAWVAVQWPDITIVIDCIKQAGGVAVLAHPSKYKLSATRLGIVIEDFVKAGGMAMEVAYPGLNPSQRSMLLRQVETHRLAVSQGSDFHHPATKWTELGSFGVNPDSFKTVWQEYDLFTTCHSSALVDNRCL